MLTCNMRDSSTSMAAEYPCRRRSRPCSAAAAETGARVPTIESPHPHRIVSLVRIILRRVIPRVSPELLPPVRRRRPLLPIRVVTHPLPILVRPHAPQTVRRHRQPLTLHQLPPEIHVVLRPRRTPQPVVPH